MSILSSYQPTKRSVWPRKLLLFAGGLFLLLLIVYFIATTSVFFKGVILPRVGKAMNAEITVASASLSPFSKVYLRQLQVRTTGAEPLLQMEELRAHYSLWRILRGTIKVDELTLASPVVQIVENADGTSNLDPLFKKDTKAMPPSPGSSASQPSQIDLKNFLLKNATIRYVKNLKNGGREVIELTGVHITLDQLKNGQPGQLTTAAAFKLTRPTNDVLEAKSAGSFDFTLGADLVPTSLQTKVVQDVVRADGSLRELAGLRATLTGDVTPTEVKEFAQRFFRGEQLLGEVKLSGPLDLSKREGRLKLDVASIDRQVLNLVGAPLGLDFANTLLNATSEIALTQGGTIIDVNTRFNAAKFSLTQQGQTTPPLDAQLLCNVRINNADKTALVQTLTLDGNQNQRPILRGNLTQPMNLTWGGAAAQAGDSAFSLAITDFNLADWKAFLGDVVSSGRLSLNLNLLSQQGGQQLKLGVTSQIADLAANLGATPLTQAALAFKFEAQVSDLKKVSVSSYRCALTRQSQPALTVSGACSYDGTAFNLQTQIEAVVARLLGSGPLTPLAASVKLDGTFTNQVLDLRQLQLMLAPTPRAAKNELNITGRLDLSAPNITKGKLAIRSDALDLTQVYDAFAGATNTSPAPVTSASQPAPGGNVEPEPVILPLQLVAEANLAQVFLREIVIQDCQVTAKIDGGKVTLDPCKLTMNGAPVSAGVDLNLGVKGYTYALTLLLDKIPLEPIANSFSPGTRGQYQGLILANGQVKGAGVTGVSLQKRLGGQLGFTFTNANLQLIGPKAKRLLVPIATLLRLNELTQPPLDWLDAKMELGNGNISVSRFAMQSAAFDARSQGVIPIAEVLTNSPLNLPVEFALRRTLAEKASLLPANIPTNVAYAPLPQFVTIKGTLGEPKADLNERALAGLLLKSGLGVAEKLGVKLDSKAGSIVQGLGNLLTGQRPAVTNQSSTNQPPTNATPKLNPLDLLKKPGN